MNPGDDLRLELIGPSGFRVVLEEDSCGAAFAYLLRDEDIVGDVWLYNIGPPPRVAPWTQPDAHPPFMNTAASTKASDERRVISADVTAQWGAEGTVDLYFGDRHEARLWPGARPGQSFMAAADGPLAGLLSDTSSA